MIDSTKAVINLDLIEQEASKAKEASEPSKNVSSSNEFKLLGEVKPYSYICYTVIKAMSKNGFGNNSESYTSEQKYANVVDNLLKNLYNSNKTPTAQKNIIRDDKILNLLILRILKEYEIYSVPVKRVEFNEDKIRNFKELIDSKGTKF